MSDSYDDYEAKMQLAEHEWEMVKTEHDRAVELGQAYERGWNAALAQQEPVAWGCQCGKLYTVTCISSKPAKQWVGLTDEEIDALSQARSLTDELMDCVDRLGSEADTVDPRVWQHLLVYAPKPEEEPVAWLKTWPDGSVTVLKTKSHAFADHELEPLYAAPPKREWVGLTDGEIDILSCEMVKGYKSVNWLCKVLESKLKEKNT